ncbi:MAG: hypothetical protein AB7P52_05260 [Alphaproteobacteria bacterium]
MTRGQGNRIACILFALCLLVIPAAARAACTFPDGLEGKLAFNTSTRQFQYCDGANWIAMHPPGTGSGGCSDPDRAEGQIVYNPPNRVMQGCAGNVWRAMGPVGGTGGGSGADWSSPSQGPALDDPGITAGGHFGYTVAVSGSTAVVGALDAAAGAGAAYVFDMADGSLVTTLNNPDPTAGDDFGVSVAVSGTSAVVGASQDDPGGVSAAGTAYVYDTADGSLIATLNNPDPTAGDNFGFSVAVSGNVAVVGAYADDPGGVNSAGTAYVFNTNDGSLIATLDNPDPTAGDWFGYCVAVSGNIAAVGAPQDDPGGISGAGTAYVFDASGGNLVATLDNPAPLAGDAFGCGVAMSDAVAVVGANRDDAGAADAGTAYVFDATDGSLLATLGNPDPTTMDYFGLSVEVDGTIAAVGASQDDAGAVNAGTAYLFDTTDGSLLGTLNNPNPNGSDYFGYSVSLSGDLAVIGAWQDDPLGFAGAGTATAFTAAGTTGPCANPDRPEGTLLYNYSYRVYQYCDGANWVPVGKAVPVARDDTPDAFGFTDQTDVALSTLIESNIVQITGFDVDAPVSIAGDGNPEYRICTDGSSDANCDGSVVQSWTSSPGSIDTGQYLQLRLTSNASYDTMNSATVAVGFANDQWDVTTVAQDTTPDAFSFTDQTDVALSTLTTSNTVNITGITGSVSVSISGNGSPQFRIAGGSWVTSGTITNGQTLQLRLTSNASGNTMNSATVTVGSANDQWDVTTVQPPSISYQTAVTSTANTNSYSFASQNIGAASPTRYVAIGIGAVTTGAAVTFTGVTIGGVAATQVSTTSLHAAHRMAIYIAAVPNGSTATISFGTTNTAARAWLAVWALYDLTSTTPTDTAVTTSGNPASLNVDLTAGDVTLAVTEMHSNGTKSVSWAGMTERADAVVENNSAFSAADHTATVSETPRTISATFASVTGSPSYSGGLSAAWR